MYTTYSMSSVLLGIKGLLTGVKGRNSYAAMDSTVTDGKFCRIIIVLFSIIVVRLVCSTRPVHVHRHSHHLYAGGGSYRPRQQQKQQQQHSSPVNISCYHFLSALKEKITEINGKINTIDDHQKVYDLVGRGSNQTHHLNLVKSIIDYKEKTRKAKVKYEEAKAKENSVEEEIMEIKRTMEVADETYDNESKVRKGSLQS